MLFVKLKYLGPIRRAAGKSEEVLRLDVPEGSANQGSARGNWAGPQPGMSGTITVGDLLGRLRARYGPEFSYYTRCADGTLPSHAMIVMDGINLGHARIDCIPLSTDHTTEIIVVPAIGGG